MVKFYSLEIKCWLSKWRVCVCARVCVGGVGGAQLGSHVWPLGLHHEGSMPGFSVWSLITYTTGPLVVACVPSTACCKACFKCSLCVPCWSNRGALCELCVAQQQRKTRHGEKVMWELKDSIQSSLKSHLRRRWWWWGGVPVMNIHWWWKHVCKVEVVGEHRWKCSVNLVSHFNDVPLSDSVWGGLATAAQQRLI